MTDDLLYHGDLNAALRRMMQQGFQDRDGRDLQGLRELLDDLRKQLLDNMFNQLSQGLSEMSPEQLQRTKDMMQELNQMLRDREEGREPDFEGFMQRYGDMFPGNPQSLDELLEQMAASMAAMSRLLSSMSPEQRAQLMQLSEQLLGDMDLRWQVDELARNLQQAFPQMGWGQGMNFRGDEPMP